MNKFIKNVAETIDTTSLNAIANGMIMDYNIDINYDDNNIDVHIIMPCVIKKIPITINVGE